MTQPSADLDELSKPGETTRTGLVATSILGAPATRSGGFQQTLDYIHWDPVKHGWVTRVADWPHSSFHDYAAVAFFRQTGVAMEIRRLCGRITRTDALRCVLGAPSRPNPWPWLSSVHPARAQFFLSLLSDSQPFFPGILHSQNIHPLTEFPVTAFAAGDGDLKRLPS